MIQGAGMSRLDGIASEPSANALKGADGVIASFVHQVRLSLLLLAAICLTFAAIAAAAHLTPVIDNHVAREVAVQRLTDSIFLYDDGYIDDGDYVLVGQLQRDDHSSGGVYFIGSSQTRTAIMPWRLPADEQRLIHNYAIGDVRHRELRFYLRSLMEEHGLLRAGGENVTVFLELSPALAAPKNYEENLSYVRHLFMRHGLYSYDAEQGIHRVPMSPLERVIRLQRIHAHRFLRILLFSPTRVKRFTPSQQTLQAFNPGPGWREALVREAEELGASVDYLQERGVHVQAILRPSGSWIDTPPYEAEYREAVVPVLAARGVTVIDQGDFLRDDEIGDDWHATASGQARLHEADRALALAALREMGVSP
jgi:hypothetical protein